jgi:hypothetical protein
MTDLDGIDVLRAARINIDHNDRLTDVSALRRAGDVFISANGALEHIDLPSFEGALHVAASPALASLSVRAAGEGGLVEVTASSLGELTISCDSTDACVPSEVRLVDVSGDSTHLELAPDSIFSLWIEGTHGFVDLQDLRAPGIPRGNVAIVDNPSVTRADIDAYAAFLLAAGFAGWLVYCEVGLPCEATISSSADVAGFGDPRHSGESVAQE